MKKSKIILSVLLSVFAVVSVLSTLLVLKSNAKQAQNDEFLFEETTEVDAEDDFSLSDSSIKLLDDYISEIKMGYQKSEKVDGKQSIRIVAEIDGLEGTPVWTRGFYNINNVDCAPNENTLTSTKAYKTLTNIGTAGEGKYYVTYTLKDIPVETYSSYKLAAKLNYGGEESKVVIISIGDDTATSQNDMPLPAGVSGTYSYYYYYDQNGWGNVNAYAYNGSGNVGPTWPGVTMGKVIGKTSWYKAPIQNDAKTLIFSNNGNNQLADANLVNNQKYYHYGWKNLDAYFSMNYSNSYFYFSPISDWNNDGAKTYLHLYKNGGKTAWIEMNEFSNGIYRADVSELNLSEYEGAIFVRTNPDLNPKTAGNGGWDAKWNQTSDQSLNYGQLYIQTGWLDNLDGYWVDLK